jgi:hypothetical protein
MTKTTTHALTCEVRGGDGDEWLLCSQDPAVGLDQRRVKRDITPEQHQAMEDALAAALEFLRRNRPKGPATVTRLPVEEAPR